MFKFKKGIFAGLLSICMLMTACGGNPNASSEATKETANNVESTTSTAEEQLTVRVGVSETGQPYVFTENGEVKGFEGDMWNEIAKRANLKVEYQYNSIPSLFGLLDNGQIDVVAHFLGRTPARAEKYDFSAVYSSADLQLMIRNDSPEITSIEELYGKKVAISLGSAAASTIPSLDPDGKIEFIPYEDSNNARQDVDMGRIDAYYGNCIAVIQDIKKMGLDCKVNPLPLHSTMVAYPYAKGNENSKKIIEKVNGALQEMLADGTIKKISEKWLEVDTTANITE